MGLVARVLLTLAALFSSDIRWEQRTPLTVYVDASAEAWIGEIHDAIEELNAAVGLRVYMAPLAPRADVQLIFDRPASRRWLPAVYISSDRGLSKAAAVVQYSRGIATGARIYLPDFYTAPLRRVQISHELGHALLLRHSQDIDSVMYRVAWRLGQRWTYEDVCKIRARYGYRCAK